MKTYDVCDCTEDYEITIVALKRLQNMRSYP